MKRHYLIIAVFICTALVIACLALERDSYAKYKKSLVIDIESTYDLKELYE